MCRPGWSARLGANPAFEIAFTADGDIPFPQVILRGQGREHLINGEAIRPAPAGGQAPAAARGQLCRRRAGRSVRRGRDRGAGRGLPRGRHPARPGAATGSRPSDRLRIEAPTAPLRRPSGRRRPGRIAGAAPLRHPQAHAPAVLQHHRPRIIGTARRTASSARVGATTPTSSRRRSGSTSTAVCRTPGSRPAGAAR